MRDPKPVKVLLLLQMLALCVLAGWWLLLPPLPRQVRLRMIIVAEHVSTEPPVVAVDQGLWLISHRFLRLRGMTGLLMLALLIGGGEGIARRRRDVLGGFLLRWWTAGVIAIPLLVGMPAAYLVLPWPLSFVWSAIVGAGIAGIMMYGLCAGRPYVP